MLRGRYRPLEAVNIPHEGFYRVIPLKPNIDSCVQFLGTGYHINVHECDYIVVEEPHAKCAYGTHILHKIELEEEEVSSLWERFKALFKF